MARVDRGAVRVVPAPGGPALVEPADIPRDLPVRVELDRDGLVPDAAALAADVSAAAPDPTS